MPISRIGHQLDRLPPVIGAGKYAGFGKGLSHRYQRFGIQIAVVDAEEDRTCLVRTRAL